VQRIRNAYLHRFAAETGGSTANVRCAWIARKGGLPHLESAGEPSLPGLFLLGADRVISGTASIALKDSSPPFVIVVDGTSVSDHRQLGICVRWLRELAPGVPLVVVAGIGDPGTLLEAHRLQIPAWVLRAGDAARLDTLQADQPATLGFPIAARTTGADLCSSRLVQGIQLDLEVIRAPSMYCWAAPVFRCAEELDRFFPSDAEVTRRTQDFIRTLTSLCVPWHTHLEAFAECGSPGPYETSSIETQLEQLRAVRMETGMQAGALRDVVHAAEAALDVLRAPPFESGKQAALLEAVEEAGRLPHPLCLICTNRPTQVSVRRFLAQQGAVPSQILVFTRAQLRRAVAEATLPRFCTLLPLHPLGFGDEIYFSGIASAVRLQVYDWEQEALEQQIAPIESDLQRSSPRAGQKLHLLTHLQPVDATRMAHPFVSPNDAPSSDSSPLWERRRRFSKEHSVIPEKPQEPPPFSFGTTNWLKRVLAQEDCSRSASADRDASISNARSTSVSARPLSRELVAIELDDGEPPTQLAPDAPVLVLCRSSGSMRTETHRAEETPVVWTVRAREVRVDWQVLFPRTEGTRDALERLLEAFNVSAEYLTATHVNDVWKDGLLKVPERIGRSGAKALAVLAQHGIPIISPRTVTRWKQGVVVGPRHAASIRAVGLATDQPQLVRLDQMIHAAQVHIRGCRIRLYRRLTTLVGAGKSMGPDALVDPDLGIRRADLDEFARIGCVKSVVRVHQART